MKRRAFLALIAPFLLAANVFAAVTIDSQEASGNGHGGTTSPLTWNFTNTAGGFLVCAVDISQAQTGGGTPTISAVSYNSVSMSLVDSYATGTPILTYDGDLLAFYSLQSPATGSHTVSVSFSYVGTPGANAGTIAGCISFSGADTSAPFGTVVKNKETTLGTNTSGSAVVPSSTSGNYVIATMNTGSGGVATTAPSTQSWLLNQSTHTGGDNSALSYQAAGGSITMAYTFTADIWSVMAVEVKAAGGGGGATTSGCGSLSLLHVGCLESN